MIYVLLFCEFFKIGMFAIGGGLVTVPFLFDLSEKYTWFSIKELSNMIAISESTPGPLGVNMATYAGFSAEGIMGGIIATLGLVAPSVIAIIIIAKLMDKYKCNTIVHDILAGIRPAVLALILLAGMEIAEMSVTNVLSGALFAILLVSIHFWKKSPIFYLCLSAIIGIALKL
ncbi:MAG: chromate transporter [Alphaproteobacteria bacterium]|nr:chromate transporter [Alphaproteobacteria bacterium]